MRRALLAGAGALAVLALAACAWLYVRDGRSLRRAWEVDRRIRAFCAEKRRLPGPPEFAELFPDLTTGADWYYWLARDGSQAHVQYPMAWARDGAPGTPKTSEFTATTYAYVVTVRCTAEAR